MVIEPRIEIRRPWSPGQSIFLLGPGGVGKTALGGALAQQLGWPFVDLDLVFCAEIGIIGPYIAQRGYDRYRSENLSLAERIVANTATPFVFATSSGFLAGAPGSEDYRRSHELAALGYGITLLPSPDIEIAAKIVVARQLNRGFGLQRETEDRKFRSRFGLYHQAGDALVLGTPTAEFIIRALSR